MADSRASVETPKLIFFVLRGGGNIRMTTAAAAKRKIMFTNNPRYVLPVPDEGLSRHSPALPPRRSSQNKLSWYRLAAENVGMVYN